MKKNYKQNIEQGIKNTTLLSSTIIILIVATIIGIVLIKTEYSNFKKHIKSFRTTLIEREMFNIQTSVENLRNDIEFEKIAILNSKKQRIKNQSIIAYNLAYSLYQNSQLPKDKQIDLIKSSISHIAHGQSDINYFILDTKGNLLLNTDNPKNEGINLLDFEDINGVKFINEMIFKDKYKQNYVEYYWYKPDKRITFSRHLRELDIIIGSASFLESKNEELRDKLLKKIALQSFKDGEYLFIYKINSLNKISSRSDLLIERNIQTGKRELNAIKELMIDTNYKGGDFKRYKYNQKLLYGVYLDRLRYFISVGVDISKIDEIVQKEKQISLDNMYSKIIKLVLIISIMTIVFFIFSLMFTKKIERIFKDYKKNVIINEEKYQLLFNHSNDAFIISEFKPEVVNIISWNKTALKLCDYQNNDLMNKDFFTLFEDLDIVEILHHESLFKTVKLKTKEGLIKTVELNTIVYSYEDRKLLFASLRDITERTILKEEKAKQENILIQKSKMAAMGEMIGNIAHQWRQPLSQISGLFFDIESAYDFKELDKKYLTNRVDEANDLLEYMSKTIDDFRNFFNPNTKKEDFTIEEAINNAIKIVNSTLKHHQIKLDIKIDKDINIHGYKNEFAQVIVNIVSNAKDILLERKTINPTIKIYLKDENTLCIEDNAGGVDENIINKIFDPYFTTKFDYGTGIGLYMTKLIIEDKMNGSITVENSENGAIFTIKV